MVSEKKRPKYEEELSPEVIAVLRELAPEDLEEYDQLDEEDREFLRTEPADVVRSVYEIAIRGHERMMRGEPDVPDWSPDPDSPMITRLWEIAKAAEADDRPIEEIQRFVEEYNRKAAEEGKLLTDDVWEGITGASLFIPLGGLDEVEEDEEDEASGEGER
ncbi:MAG TPA: hypothetical protein PK349_11560 [Candidatus Hydrogenedentes bacterium]|nr:hypothetical protein [Candidatus Hydrogenedentota bacterium]